MEANQGQEQAFAAGLTTLLTPLAGQYQERLDAIAASQTALENNIERLIVELEAANESAALPDITDKLATLSAARRRVGAVNEQLRGVRERLMRLHTVAVQRYGAVTAANNEAALRLSRLEEANRAMAQAAGAPPS
eukprot:TRINITY_DN11999_c0_g1_i1.p3 TRINITY_DN11999_c0_g1~~TRINITY_DN11999_c0_g1_i1.p3  ORF type:complete len:136 (+),score=51.40 TRINITY_DN11999_c0_g1_i1:196-603(+)